MNPTKLKRKRRKKMERWNTRNVLCWGAYFGRLRFKRWQLSVLSKLDLRHPVFRYL